MLDRLFTPYALGQTTSGTGSTPTPSKPWPSDCSCRMCPVWVFLFSLALAAAAGLAFRYLPGWWAYAGAALVVARPWLTPYVFFIHQRVFPFATPVFSAWLAALAAAGLLSPGGAARLAHGAGAARTLSAGHALRDPRDAHAAFRHPGIERADFALRPDRGEAQADRAS